MNLCKHHLKLNNDVQYTRNIYAIDRPKHATYINTRQKCIPTYLESQGVRQNI